MSLKRKLKVSLIATPIFAIMSSMLMVVSVSASSFGSFFPIVTSNFTYDEFLDLELRPDEDAYWYLLNWGDDNGVPVIIDDAYCGEATCASIMSEQGTGIFGLPNSFVRLSQTTDATPGFYTNVELAERNTGFATTEPGKYQPTTGHPVVMSARFRASSDFNVDGTGNAIGSFGFWLWNSPVDALGGYGYTEAFGFNWAPANNPLTQGLNVYVAQGETPFPIFNSPVRGINLNNWNTLRVIWSKQSATVDKLQFYVNFTKVAETEVSTMEALDLEIWHDNQTLNPETFEIEFLNPTEEQYVDLDFVSVVH